MKKKNGARILAPHPSFDFGFLRDLCGFSFATLAVKGS
jgi:hypothetical protein